jgi:hypothetical protein
LSTSLRRFVGAVFAGGICAAAGYLAGRRAGFAESSAVPGPRVVAASHPGAPPPAPTPDVAQRWASLVAAPHSRQADAEAAAVLEELAIRDPLAAVALAQQERNLRRRAEWLQAALQGWAKIDAPAAARWIARLDAPAREDAESAVMDGAIVRPEAAVELALHLMQADPGAARAHANHLLSALDRAGDYATAVSFASALPDELGAEMQGTAYQYWARSDPESAFTDAARLPGGEARRLAVDAVLSGWSQADPGGLASYAANLPPGAERTQALATGLGEWVQHNAVAASVWLDGQPSRPEFDPAVSAVALQPDVAARHPGIAASWAESITDPALRSLTLVSVLQSWSATDPAAARSYLETTAGLQADDRSKLLATLGREPPSP